VRVLLDESLPRPLAALLRPHDVRTVTDMTWTSVDNGELLRRAALAFDVVVTADQNIEFQQNLRAIDSSPSSPWFLNYFGPSRPFHPRRSVA
jgi:hypothetical protein